MTVAASYLLACWVNRDTGAPDTGAHRVKHVVRIGPNPNMPVVMEFQTGGPLSHVACAPSCIQSRLIEAGVNVSIEFIESLAGTTLAGGTSFPGCIRALDYWRIASSETAAAPAGYVMNPMLPRVQSPATFPAYFAARQGGIDCLVMAGVAAPPLPKPHPIPLPTISEDPRMFTIISFGPQEGEYLVYDDHVLVGIYSGPDVTALASLPQCHGQRTLSPEMLARYQAAAPKNP